jgi:chromatin segregation and condensation protein Rec8/ScpA/Scc1 (kleisin family)
MALRFPPVSQFVERFRALLGRRRVFDFDIEVEGLSRVEQAVALLALLELRKSGEIALSQAQPFASIRVSSAPRSAAAPAGWNPAPPPPREAEAGSDTADDERIHQWKARSA